VAILSNVTSVPSSGYPTTPAGTGIVPNAKPWLRNVGSTVADPSCCLVDTSIWSSQFLMILTLSSYATRGRCSISSLRQSRRPYRHSQRIPNGASRASLASLPFYIPLISILPSDRTFQSHDRITISAAKWYRARYHYRPVSAPRAHCFL